MLSKKEKKIGILGGSFDPPHFGHVKISKISIKQFNFEKIYWVVTKKNPLKKKSFFSTKQRVEKSKKITKNLRKVKVVYLDGKVKSSRTIKIIEYLNNSENGKKLYLIIGSDNLLHFHKWKSWKKIVKLAKLVVFSRKGYDTKSNSSIVVKYLKKKNINFVKNKKINVSSSLIKKIYLKSN